MPPFRFDLFSRTVDLTLGSYGQNWSSLAIPAVVALIYWVIVRQRHGGWRAVVTPTENWKQVAKDASLSLCIGLGVFIVVLVVNGFRAAAARDAESQTKVTDLTGTLATMTTKCAVTNGINETLQKQNQNQQITIDKCLAQAIGLLTPAQPQIKSFPITTSSRPGVPKMEYVLTTNVQRTPVDRMPSCSFASR